MGISIYTANCPTSLGQPCTVYYINKAIYIIDSYGSCCRVPGEYTTWPATSGAVPLDWTTLTTFQGWRNIPNSPFEKYPEYLLQSQPPVYLYPVPNVVPRSKAPPGVIRMNVPAILGRSAIFTFDNSKGGVYQSMTSADFALFNVPLNTCGQYPVCLPLDVLPDDCIISFILNDNMRVTSPSLFFFVCFFFVVFFWRTLIRK